MKTYLNWGSVEVEVNQKKKTYINCTVSLGTDNYTRIEIYGTRNWQETSHLYIDCYVEYVDDKQMIINGNSWYDINGEFEKTPAKIICTRPFVKCGFADEWDGVKET